MPSPFAPIGFGFMLRRARHAWKRTLWRFVVECRRLRAFVASHGDVLRRAAIIAVGFSLGWIVSRVGEAALPPSTLGDYLIAVGVMAGGAIAIVFAISVFLLQNASDLYSSPYLEAYIHDWREKLIYSTVVLITLAHLGGALLVPSLGPGVNGLRSALLLWSLGLVGVVFALIDWQYGTVRKKINPVRAIQFLEGQALAFIARLQKDARRLASLVREETDSSEGLALAAVYNQLLQPHMTALEAQLGKLAEISARLGARHEVATCRRSLAASFRVLAQYLEARATSSLIVPSDVALFAVESDSDAFLVRSFERLNRVGETFIIDGDDELVVQLLTLYGQLGAKASAMRFLSQRPENPVFDRIAAYLGFLIERGQQHNNMEVVFQGSAVLGELSAIAAHRGLDTTLLGLQDKLMGGATFGLAKKHFVVVDRCTDMLLRVIEAVFRSPRLAREHQFSVALGKIAEISGSVSTLVTAGLLPDDLSWRGTASRGYDGFPSLLANVIQAYARQQGDPERERFRRDLIEFFEHATMSVRTLAETLKDADSMLVGSVGRANFQMNRLIVDLMGRDEFRDVRDDLHSRLRWSIHVPGWFPHYAVRFNAGSHAFVTLVDGVAKTGVLAAEVLEDPQLVSECVKAIGAMADDCLEKGTDRHGYDEPRVLEKACYLGTLALKRDWQDVFSLVRLKVQEFEPKYLAKYLTKLPQGIDPKNHNVLGLPHHDQLLRELLRWRQALRRGGGTGILDDSKAMMERLIDVDDLDRFVFEVWRIRLPGSVVESDLAAARLGLVEALEHLIAFRRAPRDSKGRLT